MVRRFDPEERSRSVRTTYWISVAVIAVIWIWAFKMYFDRYDDLHPDITWAVPGIDVKLVKTQGLLMWREEVVRTPVAGIVTYPQGAGPVKVAKNSVLARIDGRELRASQSGYFVAGLDGQESKLKYSDIWPGSGAIPNTGSIKMIANGSALSADHPVGKLLEQPQELRFIGYVSAAGDIKEQVKRGKLRVLMDKEDTVSDAEIRVTSNVGGKIKMYITMPWFQPDSVKSRNYTLLVEAGKTQGAIVPETAVKRKKEGYKIYLVRGTRVVEKDIEGRPLKEGKFLITKGISVGDAVVENASEAREGRIQLW